MNLGEGIKIQLFKNMVMFNFKLNEMKKMQHHGSKYFARRTPSPDPGVKSKGITKCSNMEAIIVPADPLPHDPRGWGQKVKIQLFQNMVMLHIKLKGISNATTWLQTFGQQIIPPTPDPTYGMKRSRFNFFRTWLCCISN